MKSLSQEERGKLRAADRCFSDAVPELPDPLTIGISFREAGYRDWSIDTWLQGRLDNRDEAWWVRQSIGGVTSLAPPEIVRRLRCGELRAFGFGGLYLREWVPRQFWRRGASLHRDRHNSVVAPAPHRSGQMWNQVRIVDAAEYLRLALGFKGRWRDLRSVDAAEYLRQADPEPAAETDAGKDWFEGMAFGRAFETVPETKQSAPTKGPFKRQAAFRGWLRTAFCSDGTATKPALFKDARAAFPDLPRLQFDEAWSVITKEPEFANFKRAGRRPKKNKEGND